MNAPIRELRTALSETYQSDGVKHNQIFLEQQNESEMETIDRLFHEATKYSPPQTIRQRASFSQFEDPKFRLLELGTNPDYPGSDIIGLPSPNKLENIELSDVLMNRRSVRSFDSSPISSTSLATLLRYACGESLSEQVLIEEYDMTMTKSRRTYPSGGALYPIEIYPLLLRVDDCPSGITYYNVRDNNLRILDERTGRKFSTTVAGTFAGDDINVEDAALVIALTATFSRPRAKYGPRAYRNIMMEAGHVAQNIQLVTEALGLSSVPAAGFYDTELNTLLSVDGLGESCIYTVVIGKGRATDE